MAGEARTKVQQEQADRQLIEQILGGGDGFTDRRGGQYILNLIRNTNYRSPSAYRLCAAIEEFMVMMFSDEFPTKQPARKKNKEEDESNSYPRRSKAPRGKVEKRDWELLEQEFLSRATVLKDDDPSMIYRNLKDLMTYLDLDDIETEIIEALFVIHANVEVRQMLDEFLHDDAARVAPALALMLDRPGDLRKITHALGEKGRLYNFGLLSRGTTDDTSTIPDIEMGLRYRLAESDVDGADFIKAMIGEETSTELTLEDFSYLGEELDFLLNTVKQAVERGEKGINILLHGPPGSGKTELARVIAKALGYKMYAVGEQDSNSEDHGPGHTARHRIQQLHFAEALLKGQKGVLIDFEEPEDLLLKSGDAEKSADSDSKIQLNNLLTQNEVVRFWTANDPDKFHTAVRQRFTYSLYLDYPPTVVREKIWKRQFALKGVQVDKDLPLKLARKYATPPRLTAKAALALAMNPDDPKVVERIIAADSKLVFGNRGAVKFPNAVPETFDPGLISNVARGLRATVRKLIRRGGERKPFALFVKGAKGSGAASLVRYMAEKMAMNVMEVSLDGLASRRAQYKPPEEIIPALFNQAADKNQFLVLRDIRGLIPKAGSDEEIEQLGDDVWNSNLIRTFKASARRHKLPFAVINHDDQDIPQSFLHGFSDHIEVGALSTRNAARAYQNFFGRAAPAGLAQMKGLLLGDFDNVVHALSLRDESDHTDEFILSRLKKERDFRRSEKDLSRYTL